MAANDGRHATRSYRRVPCFRAVVVCGSMSGRLPRRGRRIHPRPNPWAPFGAKSDKIAQDEGGTGIRRTLRRRTAPNGKPFGGTGPLSHLRGAVPGEFHFLGRVAGEGFADDPVVRGQFEPGVDAAFDVDRALGDQGRGYLQGGRSRQAGEGELVGTGVVEGLFQESLVISLFNRSISSIRSH